ncbi:head-to-tail adaptor [Microbacterium phage Zeta1847]|uniref:Head-to-tail adaptor n=1 Tax=Microbacterium phage Zeta1847 TaxID=2201444 RepID=A0A2Z4Q9B1_9CAUD|nr:head-to-tail adaptor [Microbacterium phage Zeta1847]AWY06641.1 head-to-tail adaptor [Microbacterium phage Zeta1847]
MPVTLPPPLSMLESRLGLEANSLDGVDKQRALDALDDAATLILAELTPALADKWAADAPKVAVLVALKAARREYENPRGIGQETWGEHTVGLTETSGVYLTAREVAQIARAATTRRSGPGSVRIRSAYGDGTGIDTYYAPVADGTKPIPLLSADDVGSV